MPEPDDHELCRRLGRGDRAVLALLYDRHGGLCYRAALATCGVPAMAEDAVQEVFVRLARNPDGPAAAANLPAYLLRMAQNAASDQLRDRQRHARQRPLADDLPATSVDGADPDEADQVARALATLPGEQREVVQLRVWEDRSMEEIAALVGVSANTVASRWRYAVDKLSRQLKGLHGTR
jgi:RNA polymerase sigma-70 factor (ECF subfamily)